MKFNLKTIGREDEEMEKTMMSSEKTSLSETASKVLEGLGGKDNITYIDACASRLRVNLKQIEVIKSDAYFKNLGASGILKKGNSVQIVFGGLSDNIKMEIDKLM